MKRRARILAALVHSCAAALSCAAVVAHDALAAQGGPSGGPSPSFEALDKDRDGKVSVAEAADHDALFVAFKKLDANRDGALTREEFAAYQQKDGV